MRPTKEPKRSRSRGRGSSTPSSPLRDRTRTSLSSPSLEPSGRPALTPSASLLDRELVTGGTATLFEDLSISSDPNPRSFPYSVKQQCWEKAEKIRGRDPERWRRDALGNLVFRKLMGCPGCLCHDYDHIVPYSKGGQSTLENCQVLQELNLLMEQSCHDLKNCVWTLEGLVPEATVNRAKGNRTGMSKADLIQKSSYCRVSGRDMDLLELSAYGNVRRGQDSGGCRIQ